MTAPAIVTFDQLPHLGPIRLLYAPSATERPEGMITAPTAEWVAAAKRSATGFDDTAFWQTQIGKLGIGADALTVVLDDGGMTEAARVWFILQYFGLPTAVLNGGLPQVQQLPAQAAPPIDDITLAPATGIVGLMARHDLKTALNDVHVFDARTPAEFSGEDLKANTRGGHLPGAVNLDHRALLDAQQLRPASELAQMLDRAGFDGTRPVVSHCNGGGRAALAALAAVTAGQRDVRVYYLSFADWAADESCPLQ